MKTFDWFSKENYILINPSHPSNFHQLVEGQLNKIPIEEHFWIGTSGTTESSSTKWVALSKQSILNSAIAVNKHLQSNFSDIWIHTLPDFHVGGIGIWARAYLTGAKVIDYKTLFNKWDPTNFYSLCLETMPTCCALVPAQLFDLIKNKFRAPTSMRACIIGGGVLNQSLYFQARELGWCPLPSYGFSECASQVATASLDSLDDSVFPKMKILSHIVNVELNDQRKLKVKSNSLLSYYAFVNETEFSYFDPKVEGWFQTEDVMEIGDKEDFLNPLGRLDDFIKIGGESVNVSILNELLENIKLAVSFTGDCALFPFPDTRLGHVIHLVVSEDVDELILKLVIAEYHKSTLPFEKIRKVHCLKQIPRTELKKLKTKKLLNEIMSKF